MCLPGHGVEAHAVKLQVRAHTGQQLPHDLQYLFLVACLHRPARFFARQPHAPLVGVGQALDGPLYRLALRYGPAPVIARRTPCIASIRVYVGMGSLTIISAIGSPP